jgi:hypothetical protein
VAPASQWRGADTDDDGQGGAGARQRRQLSHAAIVPHLRNAKLSRSARCLAGCRENSAVDRAGAAGQYSYRDRGTDRACRAPPLLQARIAVHHEFPYPFSGIHLGPAADSGILELVRAALVPWREPGGDGGDAGAGRRIARVRFPQCGAVAARRRCPTVPAARRRFLLAAPDLPVGRPGRCRKESWSVSRTGFAGHQGHRRRWPCAYGFGAEISASRLSWRAARRTVGRSLCRRRRFRISEQDGHLRPGPFGGAGERRAGGGVSGDRPPRRHRQRRGWSFERGLRLACLAALKLSPQDCRQFAASHGWEASARAFVNNISDVRADIGSDLQIAAERPQLAT